MSRLEVDVKSIQKLIRSRVKKAQKTLNQFEGRAEELVKVLVKKGLKSQHEGRKQFDRLLKDVGETMNKSPLVKDLKNSGIYKTALDAKGELEKKVQDVQERVFEALNVPTRQELDKLNKKVDQLSRQLNGAKKKETAPRAA